MRTRSLFSCLVAAVILTSMASAFADTTYRVDKAFIRTPHFAGSVLGDVVSDLVNDEINNNLVEDDPADGYLDANFLLVSSADTVTYKQGICWEASGKQIVCSDDTAHEYVTRTSAKVDLEDADIIDVMTSPMNLFMSLMGIQFYLEQTRITWIQSGKKKIEGTMTGFISRADAMSLYIPSWVPFIGGWTFAQVFDEDELQTDSNGTVGWWFVMDFEAAIVEFVAQ